MRRALAIAAVQALALAAAPAAQAPTLARTVVADSRVMDYVRDLTALGPRLTGTAAYQRAADWTAAQLRASGVERVAFEPFTVPDAW